MKKSLMFIFFLFMLSVAASAAVQKNSKDITLDFTLNYKMNPPAKSAEHVMKNLIHITGDKWVVAGKFQTNKSDNVLLLLVRMLSHKNSKFTFQFMIIDSDSKNTFITEPKITAMAGLPAQLVIQGSGRTISLNTLINLTG